MIKRYIFNILISIDQLANAILGGDPDETISSRLGKRLNTCAFCRFICNILHKIDYRHCQDAIEENEGSNAVIK